MESPKFKKGDVVFTNESSFSYKHFEIVSVVSKNYGFFNPTLGGIDYYEISAIDHFFELDKIYKKKKVFKDELNFILKESS